MVFLLKSVGNLNISLKFERAEWVFNLLVFGKFYLIKSSVILIKFCMLYWQAFGNIHVKFQLSTIRFVANSMKKPRFANL